MLDPFFPPPQSLARGILPIAEVSGLSTLPLHIHEVLFGLVCYHLIYKTVAPIVSAWLFPTVYPHLSPRTTINWNVHVTSFIQSIFITIFALYVIISDEERKTMDWLGRIWGYTGAGGAVQGFAAGYFLWDLMVSTMHLSVLGWGSLAHAISALLVTSLGFRPFANYYGLNFVLYAISTPFLNIHWFFDKLNMTGSKMQLFNGIALLTTFFCSRILWGNYQSMCIYWDVWTALHASDLSLQDTQDTSVLALLKTAKLEGNTVNSAEMTLPTWLVLVYLGSNTILNFLNIYWFGKMVQALRKRFQHVNTKPDEKRR